jgi:GNAT superfamily N-acetyltransferase
MHQEWQRDEYTISTDPARIDLAAVHQYLTRSYWATGIPIELVARSIAGSLAFGIYHGTRQVGFARAITDRTTFAYLADVYVLEEYRRRGLSKWLMEVILAHPELQGLRRFLLATRDAHGLYAQYGFKPLKRPEAMMEVLVDGIYLKAAEENHGRARTTATDEHG